MKSILAAALLLAVSGSGALAQIVYDGSHGIIDPIKDVHDPVGAMYRAMARTAIMQNALLADMQNNQLRAAGQARIDAGRATTVFQRTGGPFAPAKYGAQAANPADRPAWTQMYAEGLTFFDYLAKENKINQNDVADGMGLAVAVAFQVYSGGQIATPEQRRIFTEATRRNLLQNGIFQSDTDQAMQVVYELHGMNAGLAAAKASMAARNRDIALRDEAVRIARNTLAGLWPYPVEGMELTSAGFDDRGVRLIREGKATPLFTPPSTPLTTNPQELQLWQAFVHYMQLRKIPMGDLAGTMGECVLINWENALAGQRLSQQQYVWTFEGMRKIILTNPDWQRMTDVDKERNLESFAVRTMAANAAMQEASKPMPEQLSGQMLDYAKRQGLDQASLRARKIMTASYKALAVLDSFFKPQFSKYTLNENGFELASAAAPH